MWQDPVPAVDHELIDAKDIAALKSKILASGLSISQLVSTAWASASSFRGTDKRGGANGARIRLAPQKDWAVNNPPELAKVLKTLEGIQKEFNDAQAGGKKKVSLADLIVLGGCAAVEKAAKDAGHDVQVPFTPGRTDASQEQTDVESFAVLEPDADGFRNYLGEGHEVPAEHLLIERAFRLTLSAPEMTVLVGGLRVLNANAGQSERRRVHQAARDVDQRLLREPPRHGHGVDADVRSRGRRSTGRGRAKGDAKWTASRVDLVFGSNSELRALAEVYACDDAQGEVRARLRGRVGQGHESRSIRCASVRPRPSRPDRRPVIAAAVLLAALSAVSPGAQAPGWTTYRDAQGRFSFDYPQQFGTPGRGTNDGFEDRVAAVRFSGLAGLGGEAALTRGRVVMDVQALGGLYDPITFEAFPDAMRRQILAVLPPVTPQSACQLLAVADHVPADRGLPAERAGSGAPRRSHAQRRAPAGAVRRDGRRAGLSQGDHVRVGAPTRAPAHFRRAALPDAAGRRVSDHPRAGHGAVGGGSRDRWNGSCVPFLPSSRGQPAAGSR